MNKQKEFNKIAKDIKSIKIQGATDIAKAAFYAYNLIPTPASKKKLLSLRATEPMLANMLTNADKLSYQKVLKHLKESQDEINKRVIKLIKKGDVIFTHCHSTSVIKALIYAKKKGKSFEVYNTETRPLYQGRKTAKDLKNAGIKVTTFVDAAAAIAMQKKQGTKNADAFFLGADAILKKGVINKVGSGMFSQIAKLNKIPIYVIADSWKYFPKNIKMESRDFEEVWKKVPKNIKIKNPSFELVKRKYIKAIISEFGTLSYRQFIKKIKYRKFD